MFRVLPRDAFNDANLLKCIGKLTMLIEDGALDWLRYSYNGEPFDIQQDPSSGSTYVSNIFFHTQKGEPVAHVRPLNSREAWPLILLHGGNEYYAFSESGEFLLSDLAA